jgi:hypothetical protein
MVYADVRSDPLNMGYRGAIAVGIVVVVIGLGLKGRGPFAKLFAKK